MKDTNIKSKNNKNLNQNKESKYSVNKYDFKIALSVPLILDKIFQFMEKDDAIAFLCVIKRYINYIVIKLKN